MDTQMGHSSSVVRMLIYRRGYGPGGAGDFACEWKTEKRQCPGCGYLRFFTVRSWRDGKVIPLKDEPSLFHDHIQGTSPVGREAAWSQRVVDAAGDAGLTGVRLHRLAVVSRVSGEEIPGAQPYHAVEITGRVMIDRNLYDGGDGLLCPECGVWKPRLEGTVRWGDKIMAVMDTGADMPDFALAANIAGPWMFCSPRAARLFVARGFSGFRFYSLLPDIFIDTSAEGWWERYCETIRSRIPGNCDL